MNIGLWSDCHNFPSLPLMKLSEYHKQLGDDVSMYSPLEAYDLVYASKTFSFTADIDEEYEVRADKLIKGGTGYCITVIGGKEVFDESRNAPLPQEIEHIYPDYELYPEYSFAVGFLTRGCPHRIYTLRDLGYLPYVMIYQKETAPREIRKLQRWCNSRWIFRSCPNFKDYRTGEKGE